MKLLPAIMIALLISLSACAQPPSNNSQNNNNQTNNAVTEYKRYEESVFRFEIPSNWKAYTDSERATFKREFEAQSRDIFLQYHGQTEGYETLVPHVFGFASPDNQVRTAGVLMRIPPQAKDYIATCYSRSKEVLEWGIKEGKVKKVIANEKTKVGKVPAIRSELIWANGEHHIALTFHFPDAPSYCGTILVTMKENTSDSLKSQVRHMLESLKLEKHNK